MERHTRETGWLRANTLAVICVVGGSTIGLMGCDSAVLQAKMDRRAFVSAWDAAQRYDQGHQLRQAARAYAEAADDAWTEWANAREACEDVGYATGDRGVTMRGLLEKAGTYRGTEKGFRARVWAGMVAEEAKAHSCMRASAPKGQGGAGWVRKVQVQQSYYDTVSAWLMAWSYAGERWYQANDKVASTDAYHMGWVGALHMVREFHRLAGGAVPRCEGDLLTWLLLRVAGRMADLEYAIGTQEDWAWARQRPAFVPLPRPTGLEAFWDQWRVSYRHDKQRIWDWKQRFGDHDRRNEIQEAVDGIYGQVGPRILATFSSHGMRGLQEACRQDLTPEVSDRIYRGPMMDRVRTLAKRWEVLS